ncbi:MAG: glycosyltransferase family 61 protein [Actinobacteria bacterium]|nr:glycosyltransferase family 61 protein [Actinomycetota bacterium]
MYRKLRYYLYELKYRFNLLIWDWINANYINSKYLSRRFRQFELKDKRFSNIELNNILRSHFLLEQHEYIILNKKNSFIEPRHGWVITGFNNILVDSLPYSNKRIPKFKKGILINAEIRKDVMPSFIQYSKNRLFNAKSIIKFKKIISLRDISEASYFHFYNDFLTKIILLENYNFNKELPLVISKKLSEKIFFQDILKRSELHNRNWIIQDKQYIQSEEIIYCKSMPFEKKYFIKISELLKAPKPDLKSKKRIFLDRSASAGRNIFNIEEIKNICDFYNFEIIDTEKINIDEQIELFSKVRSLIAVHGAGITNIIFRQDASLSLLEIFSYYRKPPHYYLLSNIFNYSYNSISGTELEDLKIYNINSNKNPFYLCPKQFELRIKGLIDEGFFP